MQMTDGGDGTVAAFPAAVPDAQRMPVTVTETEDEPIAASWVLTPTPNAPQGTAVVELANASGIVLGAPPRMRAFGEAIADALPHGLSRLVLGIRRRAAGASSPVACTGPSRRLHRRATIRLPTSEQHERGTRRPPERVSDS